MNEFDSQVIEHQMHLQGFIPEADVYNADIIIFNTCCVRDTADQKVYGRLGEFKDEERQRPERVIAVCGCLAQKDKESLSKKFPQIDLVLGTNNLSKLGNLISEICERKKGVKGWPKAKLIADIGDAPEEVTAKRENKLTAYIPISIGCDCFCTYCIVPYVRGGLKSKPLEVIVKEAEKLAKDGCKEIFLLGQNVNAYGVDMGKNNFVELLKRINDIDDIQRIRFMSPHPKDFTFDQVKEIAKLAKICRHIHLPLQAGDDLILKQMKRGYSTEDFYNLACAIREYFGGNCGITTDVIVGFPNEKEIQFENTLKFVEKMQFDGAFMFAYSKRTNTPAAKIDDKVPHDEKLQRLHKLIEAQNNITRDKNKKLIGKTLDVLFEGRTKKKKEKNMYAGRSDCGRNVAFPGSDDLIGKIIPVKITDAFTWGIIGETDKGASV